MAQAFKNGIAVEGSVTVPAASIAGAALNITGLTADSSPDAAADYMVTYDASAGTNKKVVLSNIVASGQIIQGILSVQERLAVSTDGGALTTGAWRDRILDTEGPMEIAGASLNSTTGIVTLPAGDYYLEYWSVFWEDTGVDGVYVDVATRIYDVTATAEIADSGSLAFAYNANFGGVSYAMEYHVEGDCYFALSVESELKLQMQVSHSGKTGRANPYTSRAVSSVKIYKLA